MFDSIFNTYLGAPILCGTITDLRIFYVKKGFLVLFLGYLELHSREPCQGKSTLPWQATWVRKTNFAKVVV